MSQSILKNQTFAAFCMAALIALSAVFGGVRSVNRLYARVEQAYEAGEDGTGNFCIANDLSDNAAAADNLLTVAGRYLDSSDPAVSTLRDALTALRAATGISEKYSANLALTAGVQNLFDVLGTKQLSADDESYRQSLREDVLGNNDKMARDPYNTLASEYNRKTAGFPASVFRTLGGIAQAELFR